MSLGYKRLLSFDQWISLMRDMELEVVMSFDRVKPDPDAECDLMLLESIFSSILNRSI